MHFCFTFLHLISFPVSRSWRSREFSPRFRNYWSRRYCGWTLIIRSDQTLSTERKRADQWGSEYGPVLCYLFLFSSHCISRAAVRISWHVLSQSAWNKKRPFLQIKPDILRDCINARFDENCRRRSSEAAAVPFLGRDPQSAGFRPGVWSPCRLPHQPSSALFTRLPARLLLCGRGWWTSTQAPGGSHARVGACGRLRTPNGSLVVIFIIASKHRRAEL